MCRANRTRVAGRCGVARLAMILCLLACGCEPPVKEEAAEALRPASLAVRATRRAFDGAPPVIPHRPLGITCTNCHTDTGTLAPPIGVAPANPHLNTPNEAAFQNCRQCHVFSVTEELLVENDFAGLNQQENLGERLFPGAPPVMPHRLFMHENCNACHSGIAARAEILCDHADRLNCQQCHVQRTEAESQTPYLSAAGL